jgi:serine/threonine-protein kinase
MNENENVGRVLDGRYQLIEQIGEGGMADVYRAFDLTDSREVAVKLLKKEYCESGEFLHRFRTESKAIAVLSHPNIVKIYDMNTDITNPYIVMEYIGGQTLREYMENQHGQAVAWKPAVHTLIQTLRALGHAHEKGIIHRDIKPQNIMILSDGSVKVMDFGIAKFTRGDIHETAPNQAIGSVHYISPEQATGDEVDQRSDIYSVGVMMYEMLTGQKPFDKSNPVSVAIMHTQDIAKKPRDINPDILEGLEEIILKAMEKNASARYQNCASMIKDIEKVKTNPSITFGYYRAGGGSGFSDPLQYFSATAVAPRNRVQIGKTEDPSMINSQYDTAGGSFTGADGYDDTHEYDDDYDEYADDEIIEYIEDERKSATVPIRTAVTLAVVVVAVVVVIKVILGAGGTGSTTNAVVPTLVGQNYEEMLATVTDFKIEMLGEPEFNNEFEEDIITYQKIAAGLSAKKGTVIQVKVSKGAEKKNVPNVVNLNKDEATARLTKAGFVVSPTMQKSEKTKDLVIKTDPPAGQPAKIGSTVLLYVSLGDNTEVPVDSFVTRMWPAIEADLDNFLYKIEKVDVNSSEPEGTVVKQSVPAGTRKTAADTVILEVSNGIASEGKVTIRWVQPANATGRYSVIAYRDGQYFDSSNVYNAEFTPAGRFEAEIRGEGKDVILTIVINNEATQKYGEIGQYKMNFEAGTFEILPGESVIRAFEKSGNIKIPDPTAAPTPAPTEAPKPTETDPPSISSDDDNPPD